MASPFAKITVFVQRYRMGFLLAGCGAVFSANMFYHVFPENTYKKLYQAWRKGEPASLSEKLEKTFQDVLKDTRVISSQKYSAFAAFGFHPVGAGVPWMPSGAHIGIPANFNSTLDDSAGITNRVIFINGKEVEWDSDSGAALKEALLLSPEAQKFAVAREVARLESGGPVLHAAVAPACLAGVCVYGVALKQIFGLYSGPAVLRGLVNVLAVALGAASYFLTSDALSQWLDYSSDRKAASISKDYAKGGVEFYDKILSRNKTLRTLMGQKGEEMYAPSGNLFPASLLQLKHAPYTSRREGIANLLKEEKV
ncbi:transmembrane protein 177 [Megalops cyprinoides]|uniref:transmembrane protein 177 n=1 Tax=Megalops cyprinoides TaxID=118141 RepID=UPI001864DF24|nr:transmembrane protein 177 [Megalops cyprinoides]XP_036397069.1 transmembrane protein 177 [Megalops cyprinoides]XP_036397070.1 transmembrane protein 177 [Megalops cyprinoides]